MNERVIREFPVRSMYFTPTEIQNIIEMMDGYLHLAFSSAPDDTATEHVNDLVWATMRAAYASLTEEN